MAIYVNAPKNRECGSAKGDHMKGEMYRMRLYGERQRVYRYIKKG